MNAYVKAALEHGCATIMAAPNGAQETTLHRGAYSIGGLIGPALAEDEAVALLLSAARAMAAYGDPWRNLEPKVRHSLRRDMGKPASAAQRGTSGERPQSCALSA